MDCTSHTLAANTKAVSPTGFTNSLSHAERSHKRVGKLVSVNDIPLILKK